MRIIPGSLDSPAIGFLLFSLGWISHVSLFSAQSLPAPGHLGYHPNRILIKTASSLTAAQAKTLHTLQRTRVVRSYPGLAGWQVVQLPPGTSVANSLAQLRNIPGIEQAEPDYRVRAALEPRDPDYQRQALWGLHHTNNIDIDAPEGWQVRRGAPEVIVAVIDSGIRLTHEDLAANLWVNPAEIPANGLDDDGNGLIDDLHGINAIDNTGSPADDNGHGTHVAGIIGAVGDNGRGITGVAWKVQLMACKFLDQRGEGYISDAIACLDYARRHGAQIFNLSWSDAEFSLALQSALTRARQAGLLIVAAAGNRKSDNDASPNYPSAYELDNLVAVASVNRSGSLSFNSNYGLRRVHLAAPGDSIYSTYYSWDSDYATTGGTSMAASYVSGILALLKAEFPLETGRQLIDRLLVSVKPLDSLEGRCRTGGMASLGRALTQSTLLDFASSPLVGAVPFLVSLTNSSPGLFSHFCWDFGDGSPLEESHSPTHLYRQEGRFQVTLQGLDANGLSHQRVRQVVALANYRIEPAPLAWLETKTSLAPFSKDGFSQGLRLPFLFPFYGQDYDAVYIGANGLLGFSNKGLANPSPTLPHHGLMGPILSPYGADLDPSRGGTVAYGIDGEPPRRRFAATWENVPLSNQPASSLTFQAILFEETGEIAFQYRRVPTFPNGGLEENLPVIGVGDSSGEVAAVLPRDKVIETLTNGLALRVVPASAGGLRVSPLSSMEVLVRPRAAGPTRQYLLSNTSRLPLSWVIEHSQDWLTLSSSQGVLDPGQSFPLTLSINSEASSLRPGLYQDFLRFRNQGNGLGNTTRSVALWIRDIGAPQLQIEPSRESQAPVLRILGQPRLLCRLEASPDSLGWLPLLTNRLSAAGDWLFPEITPSSPHRFFRAAELWELPALNGIGGEDRFE